MKVSSIAVLALIAVAAPAGAAHAQWSYGPPTYDGYGYGYGSGVSRQQLVATIDELCDHAEHVAHFLRAADPRSPVIDDAFAVARSARLVHQMALSGAPLPAIESDLRQLGRELSQLAGQLAYAQYVQQGRHFQADLGVLVAAFDRTIAIVQQERGGWGGGGHHAYQPPEHYAYQPPVQYGYAPAPPYVIPPQRYYRPRRGGRFQVRIGF